MLGLRTSNSIECSDLEKNIPAHNQHNICFVVVDLSMLCQRSSWLVSLCRHAEDSSGLVLFLLECVASNQHRCPGEHSQDSDTILRCFLVVTKLHLKFIRAIRVNACSHIASAFWTYHLFRQLCLPCLASNVDSCGLICLWVVCVGHFMKWMCWANGFWSGGESMFAAAVTVFAESGKHAERSLIEKWWVIVFCLKIRLF